MSQLLHKPEASFFLNQACNVQRARQMSQLLHKPEASFFPNQTCNVERARQMSQLLHKPEASRHHLVELVTSVPVRYNYITTILRG